MVMQYNERIKADDKEKISYQTMELELLQAIFADGSAGKLLSQLSYKDYGDWVNIERELDDGLREWKDFYIPASAENCQQWIKKYAEVLKAFELL